MPSDKTVSRHQNFSFRDASLSCVCDCVCVYVLVFICLFVWATFFIGLDSIVTEITTIVMPAT